MRVVEGLSTESSVVVETIQRSGMFGKLLTVEREACSSVVHSMRSSLSYRSNMSRISAAKYKSGRGRDGKEDSGLDIGIAPPQHAKWQNIGAIMVSEVVGAGVLTLSRKYAQLGWLPSTIFIGKLIFPTHCFYPRSPQLTPHAQAGRRGLTADTRPAFRHRQC